MQSKLSHKGGNEKKTPFDFFSEKYPNIKSLKELETEKRINAIKLKVDVSNKLKDQIAYVENKFEEAQNNLDDLVNISFFNYASSEFRVPDSGLGDRVINEAYGFYKISTVEDSWLRQKMTTCIMILSMFGPNISREKLSKVENLMIEENFTPGDWPEGFENGIEVLEQLVQSKGKVEYGKNLTYAILNPTYEKKIFDAIVEVRQELRTREKEEKFNTLAKSKYTLETMVHMTILFQNHGLFLPSAKPNKEVDQKWIAEGLGYLTGYSPSQIRKEFRKTFDGAKIRKLRNILQKIVDEDLK
ncbi:MAG: hypothetical protein MRZ79_06670 [Bacteroidia bacterium]|nr:hypothetical protein [Bacteroidia bacterium]